METTGVSIKSLDSDVIGAPKKRVRRKSESVEIELPGVESVTLRLNGKEIYEKALAGKLQVIVGVAASASVPASKALRFVLIPQVVPEVGISETKSEVRQDVSESRWVELASGELEKAEMSVVSPEIRVALRLSGRIHSLGGPMGFSIMPSNGTPRYLFSPIDLENTVLALLSVGDVVTFKPSPNNQNALNIRVPKTQ